VTPTSGQLGRVKRTIQHLGTLDRLPTPRITGDAGCHLGRHRAVISQQHGVHDRSEGFGGSQERVRVVGGQGLTYGGQMSLHLAGYRLQLCLRRRGCEAGRSPSGPRAGAGRPGRPWSSGRSRREL
jgi:hypothetical protein